VRLYLPARQTFEHVRKQYGIPEPADDGKPVDHGASSDGEDDN
jgi:hypothetical protein